MVGIRSVRRDKVTDADILQYVRRMTQAGSRVTTRMVAERFGFGRDGIRPRLLRMKQLKSELVGVLGKVWRVQE